MRRMARLTLYWALAVTLATAATASGSDAPFEGDGSSVVWAPKIHEGEKLAAVSVVPLATGGTSLKVFIDTARVYQHVSETSSVAGIDWMRVTESWELIRDLAPEAAASEVGWRDTDRRHRYVLREFDDMRGAFAISIYTDGSANFWIEISKYQKRGVGLEVKRPEPRLASKGD